MMESKGSEAAYLTISTSWQWSRWRDMGTLAVRQTSAARLTRVAWNCCIAQGNRRIMAGEFLASAARAVATICSSEYC